MDICVKIVDILHAILDMIYVHEVCDKIFLDLQTLVYGFLFWGEGGGGGCSLSLISI